MRNYFGVPFKTREDAETFVKSEQENKKAGQGIIYNNAKYSRTKRDHEIAAVMFNFDPQEYHFSVNWTVRM